MSTLLESMAAGFDALALRDAGGLEAVLTVMALRERWAPPTLQPAGVDPELIELGLDVVGPQGYLEPARGVPAQVGVAG